MEREQSIRQSLAYIEEHLNDAISLRERAQKSCLSTYHYHRLFRQTVGEPVQKYIQRRRMEQAAKELTETGRPIIEIALESQYASQEAFSRAFRRVYTVTPGRYRRIFSTGAKNNAVRLSAGPNPSCRLAA